MPLCMAIIKNAYPAGPTNTFFVVNLTNCSIYIIGK